MLHTDKAVASLTSSIMLSPVSSCEEQCLASNHTGLHTGTMLWIIWHCQFCCFYVITGLCVYNTFNCSQFNVITHSPLSSQWFQANETLLNYFHLRLSSLHCSDSLLPKETISGGFTVLSSSTLPDLAPSLLLEHDNCVCAPYRVLPCSCTAYTVVDHYMNMLHSGHNVVLCCMESTQWGSKTQCLSKGKTCFTCEMVSDGMKTQHVDCLAVDAASGPDLTATALTESVSCSTECHTCL